LWVALAFLLPAGMARANSSEFLDDGDAFAAVGTEIFFGSTGPTIFWGVQPPPAPIIQFFQIEGASGPLDLSLGAAPILSDTNTFLDSRDDKFEGAWLGQGAATGVVVDLEITLRGTSDKTTLTELISVTNDSAIDIIVWQYVITSRDGTGPIIDEPIDGNSFGFDESGISFLESVTPGWDYGDKLDDGGFTGAVVGWDVAAGGSRVISKLKRIEVPEPSTTALLAFGLVGLGFMRRRRASGRGVALLAAVLLMGGAGGARALPLLPLPSLAVDDISVDFDFLSVEDSLGVDWKVDDETWIRQEFFFLPDEDNEVSVLIHSNLVDVQVISASEATLTFADSFSDWDWLVSMNFDLSLLGSTSDLGETITVINDTDLDFVFIQEVITTLGGSADGDSITVFDPNHATAVDGDMLFDEVVLGIPDDGEQFEVNSFGYLWEIDAGDSDLITKDKRLEIPEPSGLALLVFAALTGLHARRRR